MLSVMIISNGPIQLSLSITAILFVLSFLRFGYNSCDLSMSAHGYALDTFCGSKFKPQVVPMRAMCGFTANSRAYTSTIHYAIAIISIYPLLLGENVGNYCAFVTYWQIYSNGPVWAPECEWCSQHDAPIISSATENREEKKVWILRGGLTIH